MQRLLAVTFLASACTELPETSEVEAFVKDYGDPECPENVCGMNTNRMKWYFNELDRNGAPNSSKYKLKKIEPLPLWAGLVTKIDVDKNRLAAYNFGVDLNDDSKIVGATIQVEDRNGVLWALEVMAVNQLEPYWAKNLGTNPKTYRIKYWNMAEGRRPKEFCDVEPGVTNALVASDVVIFEGERYDAVTKVITPQDDDSGWFNIACLNTVPGKMFMFRHTTASSAPFFGVTTTLDERHALINMWTANYCGDGRSFTASGEPLLMRDNRAWIMPPSGWAWSPAAFTSREALFDKDGAVCLDEPRLTNSVTPLEDALNVVKDHCGKLTPPKNVSACTATQLSAWKTNSHMFTVNPIGS